MQKQIRPVLSVGWCWVVVVWPKGGEMIFILMLEATQICYEVIHATAAFPHIYTAAITRHRNRFARATMFSPWRKKFFHFQPERKNKTTNSILPCSRRNGDFDGGQEAVREFDNVVVWVKSLEGCTMYTNSRLSHAIDLDGFWRLFPLKFSFGNYCLKLWNLADIE